MKAAVLCFVTVLMAVPCATAQMSMDTKGGPAAGTMVSPSAAMDSELVIIESEMMGAVKAMPAEKFSFAPAASNFSSAQQTNFTGVRSFAEQASHVAQANFFFYSMISGIKPGTDVKAIAKLTSKDDVVRALGDSFAFAHRAIATLTPANFFEVLQTPEPGIQTRGTLAGFGISHAFDHYGQMVEYLRMNGIVPPASAK
ncbi:MAG: DinB family protein [Acidobacteriota bacterium]|nr:DinB family protein [Acidobacteriota bacterium]